MSPKPKPSGYSGISWHLGSRPACQLPKAHLKRLQEGEEGVKLVFGAVRAYTGLEE